MHAFETFEALTRSAHARALSDDESALCDVVTACTRFMEGGVELLPSTDDDQAALVASFTRVVGPESAHKLEALMRAQARVVEADPRLGDLEELAPPAHAWSLARSRLSILERPFREECARALAAAGQFAQRLASRKV